MTECNVPNRTIFCDDNLDVMRGINSECIDLIYLDPPFNKNKKFTAPIGSSAEGAEFSDIFREEDIKSEWLVTIREDQPELYHYLNGIRGVGNSYNFAYLAYMAIRLIECGRILKTTGSIYLHCDPTMSHYLKALMDCVFGEDYFRREIVWDIAVLSGFKTQAKNWIRGHDTILYYTKSGDFQFNKQTQEHRQEYINRFNKTDKDGRRYFDGRGKKRYLDEVIARGKAIGDVWSDVMSFQQAPTSKEKVGYPTQKPVKLLERIIAASSDEGDTILDPFCGCATTCVAAEKLDRRWIGIDVSVKAYELVKERLTKEAADPDDLIKRQNEIHLRTGPPKRTDIGVDYRERKFVYVISHPAYPGEYKVGIAKSWQSRLNAYQTSDPDRQYKIEFKLETPLFRETEKHVHETFPNKHEWVQGDLKKIIREVENYASQS